MMMSVCIHSQTLPGDPVKRLLDVVESRKQMFTIDLSPRGKIEYNGTSIFIFDQ